MLKNSSNKWCLIRADASREIGFGHIMRCLALARALQKMDIQCVFIVRNILDSLKHLITSQGHTFILLPKDNTTTQISEKGKHAAWLGASEREDAETVVSALSQTVQRLGQPSLIICDHYGIGQIWETLIADSFSAPILVIDDLSNRFHQCQILLDATFGKTSKDYKALVPSDCQLLVGSEYALLRPEFFKLRKATLSRRDNNFSDNKPVELIVISMGGTDNDNASLQILKALEALPPPQVFNIEILIGKDCAHLSTLNKYAAQSSLNVVVHAGVDCVADFYGRADLCIGAAGSSTWERCSLGLPTINITIAENQETISQNLSRRGFVANGGNIQSISPKKFATNLLSPVITSNTKRKSLSEMSRKICDGQGISRVILALNSRSIKQAKIVSLRLANTDDIQLVYDWQNLPETRKYANNPTPPEWNQHLIWMQKKLIQSHNHFYIIQCDGVDAGVVRLDLDINEDQSDKHVISIFIAPIYFGYGVASAALSIISDIHCDKKVWAQIHADNKASISLFSRAGYTQKHTNWYSLEH